MGVSAKCRTSCEEIIVAKRTTYHVTPSDDQWQVVKQDAQRASSLHRTKKEAVAEGRRIAAENKPSQLVIHGQDGKIQEESTYGSDPYLPAG